MATAPLLTVDCWLADVRGLSDAQTAAWDAAEAEQRVRAAQLAAAALRMLTGGAVEACPYVVRPCARPCTPGTWATFPVAGAGASGFLPRLDSGTWINVHCGPCGSDSGQCGHTGASIRLPGATEVLAVWLNGAELDAADYLLSGDRLIHVGGAPWPRCQNLEATRAEADTFEVTYYQRRPGGAGERALGRLAAEYLALLAGGSCALPSSATSVARQGVTITLTPGAFPKGLTGVREVDAWVQAINPHHLTAPSEVLTPDTYR